jgi:hypothetical protein
MLVEFEKEIHFLKPYFYLRERSVLGSAGRVEGIARRQMLLIPDNCDVTDGVFKGQILAIVSELLGDEYISNVLLQFDLFNAYRISQKSCVLHFFSPAFCSYVCL